LIVLEHGKGWQTRVGEDEKNDVLTPPSPPFTKKSPEGVENKGIGTAKERKRTTRRPEVADDK
jgi:hypothetical protein